MRYLTSSPLTSLREITLCTAYALTALSGLNLIDSREASATVAHHATVQSLTEQANLIVYARVGHRWTPKTRGPQGQIYTYTELITLETWRGEVKTPLLLVQLGGQLGDLTLKIEGDAELKTGREVVLFLTSSPRAQPPVPDTAARGHRAAHLISLAQGVFHLSALKSPQGDTLPMGPSTPLYQELDGIVFYKAKPSALKLNESPALSEVAPEISRVWTLAQLKARVTQLARGDK